jgi:ABC-type oligopeptide transport system substrate-binding subunit
VIVVGKMKLIYLSLVVGLVLTFGFGFSSSSFASDSSSTALKITSVKVTDANTVHVTFNNQLKKEQAALDVSNGQNNHFFGAHLGASTPHIHAVSNIALSSDGKTVTLTLKRALHKDDIDLAVLGVVDINGNTLSSTDWEVWDSGAGN